MNCLHCNYPELSCIAAASYWCPNCGSLITKRLISDEPEQKAHIQVPCQQCSKEEPFLGVWSEEGTWFYNLCNEEGGEVTGHYDDADAALTAAAEQLNLTIDPSSVATEFGHEAATVPL